MTIKKLTACGTLSAFALAAFMLENLFPPVLVVGGRIGIANFFVLIAGIFVGFRYGAVVLIIKSVLGSIMTGNIGAVLYSLPAGIAAYVIETYIITHTKRISLIAASVFGGVINSCLQNLTFCIITRTPEYLVYLPYLTLVGVIGGLTVGLATYLTVKFLPENLLDFGLKE